MVKLRKIRNCDHGFQLRTSSSQQNRAPAMHANPQASTNASRSFQIKRPVSSASISPTTTLPSRAARIIRTSSFASASPQILRATAGAKSPLLAFSPATGSDSAASSRSTQRAVSLDTSLSPPSTPTFENASTTSSAASNRDGVEVRQLRAHMLRLENLASDAQQRLHAETQALQEVQKQP